MEHQNRSESPPQSNRTIDIVDWGVLPFAEAHRRQLAFLDERIAGQRPDTIFLVEHPHVYTYGRSAAKDLPEKITVLNQEVAQVAIERGGDVTYHGPGQLVIYPILDVRALTGDLHAFLHWLEDVLIDTIAAWGVTGRHHPEHTGVWVDDHKIASIGVAVRKWISYHGAALNVETDLRFFDAIQPCGLPSDVMTSLAALLGRRITIKDVKAALLRALDFHGVRPRVC